MKRLEDIPKRNIFETPDGYFDRLPLKIQSRVEMTPTRESTFYSFTSFAKFAIPVMMIGSIAAYILWPKPQDQNDLLASVSTEHLAAYLSETDTSTEDLLEEVNLNEVEADSLNAVINSNYTIEGIDLNEMQDVLDNEL